MSWVKAFCFSNQVLVKPHCVEGTDSEPCSVLKGVVWNSEKNKRSSPRSSIDTAVFVHIMDEWIECKTIDLSSEAISVEMAYSLVPGSLVALDMHQSKGMKKYEMLTEILRCDTLETDPVSHRSVMKYIDPSEDFLRDVKSLTQSKSPE